MPSQKMFWLQKNRHLVPHLAVTQNKDLYTYKLQILAQNNEGQILF